MSATGWLRIVALVESLTYLSLLAATIAKRAFAQPEWVPIIGPIHGVVFIAYFALVIFARDEQGWGWRETVLVLVAAVIPFGGYLVERRLVRDPERA